MVCAQKIVLLKHNLLTLWQKTQHIPLWVIQKILFSLCVTVYVNETVCCCVMYSNVWLPVMYEGPLSGFLTLKLPPPGSWLRLSIEPILDWALSLKLTLWDSIFTSPPPGGHTESVKQHTHEVPGIPRIIWKFDSTESGQDHTTQQKLTGLVLDVGLWATLCCHFAQVHLFGKYLNLQTNIK